MGDLANWLAQPIAPNDLQIIRCEFDYSAHIRNGPVKKVLAGQLKPGDQLLWTSSDSWIRFNLIVVSRDNIHNSGTMLVMFNGRHQSWNLNHDARCLIAGSAEPTFNEYGEVGL